MQYWYDINAIIIHQERIRKFTMKDYLPSMD